MSTERHTPHSDADDGRIADHQSERPGKLPYEAPQLRSHAKLPVITAGSISQQSWRFGEVEGNEPT